MKEKKNTGLIIVLIIILVLLTTVVGIFSFMLGNKNYELKNELKLGNRYLENEEYEEAVEAFKKAIKISPKCEEAYIGIAEAYIGMDEYEEAVEYLEKLIDITQSRDVKKKAKAAIEELKENSERPSKAEEELVEEPAEAVETEEAPEEDEEPKALGTRKMTIEWDSVYDYDYASDTNFIGLYEFYLECNIEGIVYDVRIYADRIGGQYYIREAYDYNGFVFEGVTDSLYDDGQEILSMEAHYDEYNGYLKVTFPENVSIDKVTVMPAVILDKSPNAVISSTVDSLLIICDSAEGSEIMVSNAEDYYTRYGTGFWGVCVRIDWDELEFYHDWE